jgi:hypothetical protein
MSNWMDGRSRGRETQTERGCSLDRCRGESSRGRYRGARELSPLPSRDNLSPPERRALRELWSAVDINNHVASLETSVIPDANVFPDANVIPDAIVLVPNYNLNCQTSHIQDTTNSPPPNFCSEAIEIIPNVVFAG